ncbi:MAG: hypothetical protein F4206_09830 [Gammaproteobacteria bacterium]|nr:hypothetical protein [Gammaproteobacteria bacterium]MYG67003.1 hypothetical protein [Gammaproteobacteria bacterium]
MKTTTDALVHGSVTVCRHGSPQVPKSRDFSAPTTGAPMHRQVMESGWLRSDDEIRQSEYGITLVRVQQDECPTAFM